MVDEILTIEDCYMDGTVLPIPEGRDEIKEEVLCCFHSSVEQWLLGWMGSVWICSGGSPSLTVTAIEKLVIFLWNSM